jgi:hypothetical protein
MGARFLIGERPGTKGMARKPDMARPFGAINIANGECQ